jgi:hypothetical protein
MTRITRLPLLLVLALLGLALPAVALAASGTDVREDCLEDGKIDGNYSAGVLREALSGSASNEDEYGGDCRDLIQQELSAKVAGSGSAPAGAGARGGGIGGVEGDSSADGIPDTNEDFNALQTAIKGVDDGDGGPPSAPSLAIGDQIIVPEAPPAALATAQHPLPPPVRLALIALAALALTAGMIAARRRYPQVRRAALGLLRR